MNKIEELEEKISTIKGIIDDPDLDDDIRASMEVAFKNAQQQLDILKNDSHLKVVEIESEQGKKKPSPKKKKQQERTIDSIANNMLSLAGFIKRNENVDFHTQAKAKASSLLRDKLARTYVERVLELGGDLNKELSNIEASQMRHALGTKTSVVKASNEEVQKKESNSEKPKVGRPKLLPIEPQVPGELVLTEALKQRGVLQEDIDLSNKIKRTITVIFVHKQVPNTVDQDKDENIIALEPGLRLKPNGTLYYENRENRSDMNSGRSRQAA